MKLSIAYKLSLSSILLVLTSTGVVGWVFYSKTTDILVEQALKRIALDVQEAGNSLQQLVTAHDSDVLFLAKTEPIQGMIRSRSQGSIAANETKSYSQWSRQLETIFETLLERKLDYQMIRFIDQSGNELVSVQRDISGIMPIKPKQLQNKAHRSYVRETLKLLMGGIYLSEINLNREFGQVTEPHAAVLRISTPIYDERTDDIAGLIVITLQISQELRAIQRRASNQSGGVIYITNDSGGYLLHPNPEKTYGFDLGKHYRIQDDIPLLAEQFLPDSLSQHVSLMPEQTGGTEVVNFAKISFDLMHPDRFIAVAMTLDYKSIAAQASAVLNDIVLWVLVLVLAGMSVAVFFAVRITRPIHQMTLAVNEFSLTHLLCRDLPVNLNDEVGVLARAFNSMIQQVKQSQARLEELNVNLESRVIARTDELNKARIEAERANLAKSDFLSSMSHELRTPMNAILGFGQLLEMDAEGFSKTQRENISEILVAGNHLLGLISEVLDLAKIESGKLELNIESVTLDRVMRQSISLIQPMATARSIELVDNVSGKGCIVQADPVRLKQVLVNLLSNAVKYNCAHGRITIDCETISEQSIRIQVTDSGLGMTEDDIDKLFSPFERLNKVHNVEGVGIGLVITKHLVDLMDGCVGVESVLGQGSTFWVELVLLEDSMSERVAG